MLKRPNCSRPVILTLLAIFIILCIIYFKGDSTQLIHSINVNTARIGSLLKFKPDHMFHDSGPITTRDIRNVLVDYDLFDSYAETHLHRFAYSINLIESKLTEFKRSNPMPPKLFLAGEKGAVPLLLHKLLGVEIDHMIVVSEFPPFIFSANSSSTSHLVSIPIGQQDLEKSWAYPDSSIDFIICLEVVEHFAADPYKFYIESNRILNSKGTLLLSTPNSASWRAFKKIVIGKQPWDYSYYTPNHHIKTHTHEYSIHDMRETLQNTGFEIKHHSTCDVYGDELSFEWESLYVDFLERRKTHLKKLGESIFNYQIFIYIRFCCS